MPARWRFLARDGLPRYTAAEVSLTSCVVGISNRRWDQKFPQLCWNGSHSVDGKERVGGAAVMSLVGGLGSRQRIAKLVVVVVVVAHGPAKIAHCAQAS